jgi:GntR family transcriptional regulator
MIEFHLETRSGVPTYLQIVQQVRQAIRLGVLRPGDQLPTVKDVVGTLTVNPNTVLKAYRELEHKGLASGRPGTGTFIEASLTPVSLPELANLRSSLHRWLDDAAAAGLDDDGVVALVESALRDFPERSSGTRGPRQRRTSGGGAA